LLSGRGASDRAPPRSPLASPVWETRSGLEVSTKRAAGEIGKARSADGLVGEERDDREATSELVLNHSNWLTLCSRALAKDRVTRLCRGEAPVDHPRERLDPGAPEILLKRFGF
jgi:hypothetical protein